MNPAAIHHHTHSITIGVDQFAFPTPAFFQRGKEIDEGNWIFRLQQDRNVSSQRFFGAPAVQAFGSAIPVGDPVRGVADECAVCNQVKQLSLRRGFGKPFFKGFALLIFKLLRFCLSAL
jgi:hypothetical protein